MLGRPASWDPVWAKVIAGSWLIASVTMERTMQSLSAMAPVWVIRSPIRAPHSPRRVAPNLEGAIGKED